MGVREELKKYPDISFIDDITLENLKSEMLEDAANFYQEKTGEKLDLADADPVRMILYAASLQIYQAFRYIDAAGKQSFLKYAYGNYLDNLGSGKRIEREQGAAARTRLLFTLSARRMSVTLIPAGTRVTAGDELYFATIENLEIPAGELQGTVTAECKETGIKGNGYELGSLNILVDPVAYIDSVANITVTSGGADLEDDDNLADRIYLAPSSYSVAGPDGAYEYWAKTYNPGIEDVFVDSKTPGTVDIYFIMSGGEIPDETMVEGLQEYLEQEEIRPLTDKVVVQAPGVVNYSIDFSYFINQSDAAQAAVIQTQVQKAVSEYVLWQKTKVGRDINPSELVKRVMAAGAKRVEIRKPDFKKIEREGIAVLEGEANIIYGGLEDD